MNMLCQATASQLLIIDIQERLCSTMHEKVLKQVLKNTNILSEAANKLAIPIIRTEQYPKGLGPTHAKILSHAGDTHTVYEKTCFSGCGASGMENHLRDIHRPQIIVTGMEAHICVLQTAMELQALGKQVFVVQDAVISRNKHNFRNAIERLRQAGIVVSNTESVLFEWLKDAANPQFKELSKLIR
jgi:isochorismate hydrolase